MYEQVEKPKENKSRAVANSVAQKQSSDNSTFKFVDNRQEAVAQRRQVDKVECGYDGGATIIQLVKFSVHAKHQELVKSDAFKRFLIINKWQINEANTEIDTLLTDDADDYIGNDSLAIIQQYNQWLKLQPKEDKQNEYAYSIEDLKLLLPKVFGEITGFEILVNQGKNNLGIYKVITGKEKLVVKVLHPQKYSDERLNRIGASNANLAEKTEPKLVKVHKGHFFAEMNKKQFPCAFYEMGEGETIEKSIEKVEDGLDLRLLIYSIKRTGRGVAMLHFSQYQDHTEEQFYTAHNDLNSTNILISQGGTISLVDVEGMDRTNSEVQIAMELSQLLGTIETALDKKMGPKSAYKKSIYEALLQGYLSVMGSTLKDPELTKMKTAISTHVKLKE